MATKKKDSPRNRLFLARALFAQGFAELKALPRKGPLADFDQSIHDYIYGSDDPDLEKDLLSTLDGWLDTLDEH